MQGNMRLTFARFTKLLIELFTRLDKFLLDFVHGLLTFGIMVLPILFMLGVIPALGILIGSEILRWIIDKNLNINNLLTFSLLEIAAIYVTRGFSRINSKLQDTNLADDN